MGQIESTVSGMEYFPSLDDGNKQSTFPSFENTTPSTLLWLGAFSETWIEGFLAELFK